MCAYMQGFHSLLWPLGGDQEQALDFLVSSISPIQIYERVAGDNAQF